MYYRTKKKTQDLNLNIVKITVQKWFVPTKKKILPLGAEIVVLNYWIIKPFQRFWCLLRFSFDYCVCRAHGVVFPSAYPQKVQQEKEVDIKQKVGWKYLFLKKISAWTWCPYTSCSVYNLWSHLVAIQKYMSLFCILSIFCFSRIWSKVSGL